VEALCSWVVLTTFIVNTKFWKRISQFRYKLACIVYAANFWGQEVKSQGHRAEIGCNNHFWRVVSCCPTNFNQARRHTMPTVTTGIWKVKGQVYGADDRFVGLVEASFLVGSSSFCSLTIFTPVNVFFCNNNLNKNALIYLSVFFLSRTYRGVDYTVHRLTDC